MFCFCEVVVVCVTTDGWLQSFGVVTLKVVDRFVLLSLSQSHSIVVDS